MGRKAIPQELIDLTIDEVANDKDKLGSVLALRSCALTSSLFLARARKHLFAQVTLTEDMGQDKRDRSKLKRLLQILKHHALTLTLSPLAANIKTLVIHLTIRRGSTYMKALGTLKRSGSYRDSARLSRDELDIRVREMLKNNTSRKGRQLPSLLPSILRNLAPSVHTFSISVPNNCRDTSWTGLDSLTRTALLHFIVFQPIIDIQLRGITGFPINVIAHLSKLRSLSLCDMWSPDLISSPLQTSSVQLDTQDNTTSMPSSLTSTGDSGSFLLSTKSSSKTLPVLEKLAVKRSPAILKHLATHGIGPTASHKQLSSVWNLDISMSSYSYTLDLTWKFVQTLTFLSHLSISEITQDATVRTFMGTLDLGSLKRLSHLEIDCRFGGEAENVGLRPLTHWMIFNPKETSASPLSIETLVITEEWGNCRSGHEDSHFWPQSGWKVVDSVLSDRSRFPRLCVVRFILALSYRRYSGIDARSVPSMEKNLSRLVEVQKERLLPSVLKVESGIQVEISITARPYATRRPNY